MIKHIKVAYFSATGTTKKIVMRSALALADILHLPVQEEDFTLPRGRKTPLVFSPEDFVFMATPVYAGRVPNVLLEFLRTMQGNGAMAAATVVYGNRDFDDALIELRDLLDDGGAHTVAAAAFVGEHSFSTVLGAGRPDTEDLQKADLFALKIAEKLKAGEISEKTLYVRGRNKAERVYYTPRDRKGAGIDIRKVTSKVDAEKCDNCRICVAVCPMGSISRDDVAQYTGICIKCGACIKKCPRQARYYDDPGYLYHKHELEVQYTASRAEPKFFL